jgi:hypothetical protein
MVNQGGHDVWVAKVDEYTGNVHWLTQLGNFGDESPARHKSVAVNKDGNVVIYGDTTSMLYRPREDESTDYHPDMFVMIVNGTTGAVDDNYYMGGTSSATVSGSVSGNPLPGDVQVPKDEQPPLPPQVDDQSPVVTPTSTSSSDSISKSKKDGDGGLGIAVVVILAVAATALLSFMGLMVVARRKRRRRAEEQKSGIFSCLQKFDVEDIDLRRSPPGGWHGTYMNKLAYGVNDADVQGTDSSGSSSSGTDGLMVSPLPENSENSGGYSDYPDKPDEEEISFHRRSPSKSGGASDLVSSSLMPSSSFGGGQQGRYSDYTIDDDDEVDIRLKGGKMA